MERIWVVAANAARARIWERDPQDARLVEREDFVHPAARQKSGELQRDRAGHTEHGHTGQRHGGSEHGGASYAEPTDVHARERGFFARELAQHLERAVAELHCPGWLLYASDPFLGVLKAQLGGAASKALIAAEAADVTAWPERDLARRVTALLEARL